jgi:hypothetical protein
LRRTIHWKRWLALVFVSAAAGFILHLARDILAHQPPAWLQTRKIAGPSLSREALRQFRALVDAAQREADRLGRPVGSVQLYEVRKGKTEPMVWNLEPLGNPGFEPQSRFQYEWRGSEKSIAGYYALDGKPLPALVRKLSYLDGRHPTVEFVVNPPVRPGAELRVIRLERGRKLAETMRKDGWLLSLDRLPATNAAVAARAVLLPPGVEVVRYSPDSGLSSTAAGMAMVSWLNTSAQTGAPAPSVTFRWSR